MKTLAKPGFTEERRKVIRIRLMNRQNEIEECGQRLKKQKRELNLETARLEGQARQRRIEILNRAMEDNDHLKLFNTINTWKGVSKSEFPDKLTVGDKTFENDQVLERFTLAAEEQAQQEGMFDPSPNTTYVNMKVHNAIYRKILKLGHRKVRKFTHEEIKQAVKNLAAKKAQDIYGVAKEHLAWLSDEGKEIIYPMISEMLQDPRHYSSTMNNMSVASYLYKGKKKPRDAVSSYRKILIGTTMSKAADALMAPITQSIAKKSQQGTQFGFTEGLNYLLCGLL